MKTINNLNIIIRPVNELCNLNCSYCNTKKRYNDHNFNCETIKLETIQHLIEAINTSKLKHVRFTWHGGEPLLLSDDFYHNVFGMQKGIKEAKFTNTIQTNGILLNEKRLSFFKENNIAIGFSLDGSEYYHNSFRFENDEEFNMILKNILLAKKLGVRFSIIMVVHSRNIHASKKIFDFITILNPPNGFIISPLFLGKEDSNSLSIKPDEFSGFLISFYEYCRQNPSAPINNYTYALKKGMNMEIPKLCFLSGRCTNFISMNGSGDMFSTCHENPDYYIGNINIHNISTILSRHIEEFTNKIKPQFKNKNIYKEMGCDTSLIYFQGQGCTKRLINGMDPYFTSYIKLISHAKKYEQANS